MAPRNTFLLYALVLPVTVLALFGAGSAWANARHEAQQETHLRTLEAARSAYVNEVDFAYPYDGYRDQQGLPHPAGLEPEPGSPGPFAAFEDYPAEPAATDVRVLTACPLLLPPVELLKFTLFLIAVALAAVAIYRIYRRRERRAAIDELLDG